MRKGQRYLPVMAALLIFASCNKEKSNEDGNGTGGGTDSSTVNTEVGTWSFVSFHNTLSQTIEFTYSGMPVKAINTSDYTSTKNSGTIKFDGSTMTVNGLSFAVNTTAKTMVYLNGVLSDSLSTPIDTTIAASSLTAGYKKIGADSLYFANGGLVNISSGGTLSANPAGYKLKWSGNQMTMTTVFDDVESATDQGINEKITNHAVIVATLQKQN